MSLTEFNAIDIAKKQFLYKNKAFANSLISLITIQAIAILFSLNGLSGYWMGSNPSIEIKSYSATLILVFSIFWAFIIAITLTTKPYRYLDFTFVSNRASSHLSSLALLLLYSFIGGLSSILSGVFLRVILYFVKSDGYILGKQFFIPFPELVLSIYIATLYLFLFAVFGYFIGMLVQRNKSFTILVPAALIGWFILEGRDITTFTMTTFFFKETSVILFSLKVLITIVILICVIIPITNRLEVRK